MEAKAARIAGAAKEHNRNNQLHAAHAGADLDWRAMEAVGGSQWGNREWRGTAE
jgi:hypothetical protein